MCGLPLVLTALTTAVSMAGSYVDNKQQTAAAQAQADYQAQMAANEATRQQQLAQNELAKGQTERDTFLRSATKSMGTMKSQLAAGNFTLNSGSNLSLLAQEAQELQHQAQLIGQNSAEAAYGHQTGASQAMNQKNWAEYEKRKASSNKSSLLLDMGGTLLGGIGRGLNK